MKKILLTGFEPFHKASSNPTKEIVRIIESEKLANVKTLVLPVEFGKSGEIACEAIDEFKPDVVIALGQAEGRSEITPEKIAINLDHTRIPDNAGKMPNTAAIIQGGPDGLFSTLPIEDMVTAFQKENVPASISYSAGTFVCNHVFYSIQFHCKNKNIRSGFVHVPLMESQASEFPGMPTMEIYKMVAAIRTILRLVQ